MTLTSGIDHRLLLRAYQEHGDTAARDRVVTDYLPLVRSLARRYAGRGELLEDLVQVGSIGLIKAVERFDLDRDVELATYAVPTIVGEIKRHFRDRVWSVTVSRRLKELYFLLSRLLEELTASLGRSPTVAELAVAAGVDEEEVVEALEVGRAFAARSLSAGVELDDGSAVEPVELLSEVEPAYAATEDRAMLASGFRALDAREREILRLRFLEGLTQSQIGLEVGISQMHVSRLIRRALEKLREEIEEP